MTRAFTSSDRHFLQVGGWGTLVSDIVSTGVGGYLVGKANARAKNEDTEDVWQMFD